MTPELDNAGVDLLLLLARPAAGTGLLVALAVLLELVLVLAVELAG